MIALRVRHDSRVVHEAVFSLLPVTTGGSAMESVSLEGRLVVRIGKTDLEIEPVPDCPTLEIPVAGSRPERRRRGAFACLAYLAVGVAGIVAGQLVEPSFWSPWNHTRWVGLVRDAITTGLVLPLAAGALFLVLKVIGRQVRMADTLRALALLAWLIPVLSVVFLAAYYPLAPSQLSLFQGALAAVAVAIGLATLASVRREPRSLAFTSGWAATALVVIAGLATMASMSSRQTGEPSVDLSLQAPLAGYAGRAESLDDYLRRVRSAARSGEDGRERPAQTREGHAWVPAGRDPGRTSPSVPGANSVCWGSERLAMEPALSRTTCCAPSCLPSAPGCRRAFTAARRWADALGRDCLG